MWEKLKEATTDDVELVHCRSKYNVAQMWTLIFTARLNCVRRCLHKESVSFRKTTCHIISELFQIH